MYSVKSVFEDDFHLKNKEQILEYCRTAFELRDHPSYENMWSENWENDKKTLPYLIYSGDRISRGRGEMFMLFDERQQIVANSGINISDFDESIAIGGVRTWLRVDLRGQFVVGRHMFPYQLRWAKEKNMKIVALTFNEYNKKLVNHFKRSGLGIKKNRHPDTLFYNGVHVVDFPVMINATPQWVVYHKIDESYEPDWKAIAA